MGGRGGFAVHVAGQAGRGWARDLRFWIHLSVEVRYAQYPHDGRILGATLVNDYTPRDRVDVRARGVFAVFARVLERAQLPDDGGMHAFLLSLSLGTAHAKLDEQFAAFSSDRFRRAEGRHTQRRVKDEPWQECVR